MELKEIFGYAAFTNPKPTRLIERILRIATGPGDLVLDFFAGSGTTAHTVLKLNAEGRARSPNAPLDDADAAVLAKPLYLPRRFILVSNTEATPAEPDKNLCRDVCARRVRRVIEGYGDTPGLGGNFAYLRARRISPGQLLEIEHEQVWNALQLLHTGALAPYDAKPGFLWTGDEHEALAYVPRFTEKLLPSLRSAIKTTGAVTIYSWQPELLRQRVRSQRAHHEAIPETLARKFGMRG
jgi:adenine-specific DNA-methyltransferase